MEVLKDLKAKERVLRAAGVWDRLVLDDVIGSRAGKESLERAAKEINRYLKEMDSGKIKDLVEDYLAVYNETEERDLAGNFRLSESAAMAELVLSIIKGKKADGAAIRKTIDKAVEAEKLLIGAVPRVTAGMTELLEEEKDRIKKMQKEKEILAAAVRDRPEYEELQKEQDEAVFRDGVKKLVLKIFLDDLNRFPNVQGDGKAVSGIAAQLFNEKEEV